jgi:excisionase family DNA binding protein
MGMTENSAYNNNAGLSDEAHNKYRLINREEAAKILKISINTIDRLRYQRRISYYVIGDSVRFGMWDLMDFISNKPASAQHYIKDTNTILTKSELAIFLNVSTRTIEKLIKTGCLWHRKTGRILRFLLSDILTQLSNTWCVSAILTNCCPKDD